MASYLLIILSGSAQLTRNTWTPINIRRSIKHTPTGEYSNNNSRMKRSSGNLWKEMTGIATSFRIYFWQKLTSLMSETWAVHTFQIMFTNQCFISAVMFELLRDQKDKPKKRELWANLGGFLWENQLIYDLTLLFLFRSVLWTVDIKNHKY